MWGYYQLVRGEWWWWLFAESLPPLNLQAEKSLGQPEQCTGNPCNPANGNKYQLEEDYRSVDGVPSFTRHYNSFFNQDFAQDLRLGYNWNSSFHQRLELLGHVLQKRTGNGRGEPFIKNTSGQWQSDPDINLILIQDSSGYSLILRNDSTERYNLNGKLLSETSRTGTTTTYDYDTNGRLATVTGPFGHTLTFGYDANNHLSTVTDPNQKQITYSYDANNNLTRVDYPDLTAKKYFYENARLPNRLTGISYVDNSGVETRLATYAYYFNTGNNYDPNNGKAITTQHAQTDNGAPQEKFTLAYNSTTQTTVTDPMGMNEVMTFATNLGVKNLTSKVNQGDGKSVEQTFDANNNLTCRKDEESRITTYTYNATNQRTGMTEGQIGDCASPGATSATRAIAYQYLSSTLDLPTVVQSPSVATGQNKTTAIQYNDAAHPNLPTLITQNGFTPAGAAVARTVTLGYNALGQVNLINGPRTDVSDITTLEYNECTTGGGCGQLKKVTNALGHITTYDFYDANGRVTQTTDPNGLRTNYSYDARGRVRFITQTPPTDPARVTEYRYTAFGEVAQAIMPDGVTLTYGYDAAQYLRSITDNLGNRVTYHYDLKGNRDGENTTDSSGSLVRSVSYAYDLRNRVSAINTAGSVTQQIHDAVGNLVQEIDPNNNPATQHTPDALNRLVQTVDRLSGVTAYAYDRNDRLAQLQSPNGATTGLLHDDLGNLLQETSPDRGTTNYTYDAAGNLSTMTDARGIQVIYSYDALNRLTLADYPGTAEDITYAYDTGTNCGLGLGRLCTVTDQSSATQYGYDAYGNITTQIKTELGVTYTTGNSYDAGNRVTSITYPDGRVLNYTRDVLGRIASVTTTVNGQPQTVVGNRGYRPDGLVTAETYGNNLNATRVYDTKGQLRELYVGSVDTRLFGYDLNGNLTSTQALPQVGAYLYDALDRLTQDQITTTGTTITTFGYDANGNRTSENSGTYIYLVASNRLSSTPSGSVTVNNAGQTLSDGSGRSYIYNAAGQVQQVTLGGTTGNYLYDYRNLRTRKTVGGQSTVYHYDLAGRLLAETQATGPLVRAYLYADDTPVAQIDLVTVLPPEVILDNPQAVFTGTWPTAMSLPGFYGSNYQTNAKGPGKDKAVWTPNLPSAGSYQVYARWVAAGSHARNAPFTIKHSAGSATVLVNQRLNGGQWILLGTYSFSAGTAGTVTLTDKANGTVIADAVKLVPTGGGTTQEALRYLHTDHLNTPRLATDAAQQVLWRWDGGAFGETVPNNDPDGDGNLTTVNLRYPGQYFDAETGLHYNWYRYYEPKIGRYITSDPIGLRGGLNTFTYVSNNPLRWIDPTGLDATVWNNTQGGRGRWNGPTNGNWGGKCWSGGQYSCGSNTPGNASPTDSADACYKRHDNCYIACGTNTQCIATCNAQLTDELRNLHNDPRQWPQPPRPGTEGDTIRYRNNAIEYFTPPGFVDIVAP